MSLDIDLLVQQPSSIYADNITHNLAKMASNVHVAPALTLYQILWRPEEHGLVWASDIAEHLDTAWNILLSEPEYFKQFNPSNGWGSYDSLLNFTYNYRNACWKHPHAEIQASR
jgi:hypothetical protein